MKNAVIVGGSNGIGYAICLNLIEKGYHVTVVDREIGQTGKLHQEQCEYISCDLMYFDEELFRRLAEDENTDVLMITAGIGRIADFEWHHIAEIEKIFTIDAVSTVKILLCFYNRIKSGNNFYAGVMGSISGWLCSPAASVYSAAKAGVVRIIESLNIELEVSGTENRILDVSPGAFKGSRFYGGKNDVSQMSDLADQILENLFRRATLFIPEYDSVFRKVLENYYADPHGYGLYSYKFKEDSGRLNNRRIVKIGYLSGTFDLFHIGHLNLLRRAKQQCDYLIVGVHKDGKWKGKETFYPLEERKQIVQACKYVDRVVDSCIEDSDAWEIWHYDKLFVGSDYKGTERFNNYEKFFSDKEVEIVYFPYTKGTSSTQIREMITALSRQVQE